MHLNSRLDIPHAATLRSGIADRARRETAQICRERAAADLLASMAMVNAHQRKRMETSATVWTQRAEMLQRVEDGLAQRLSSKAPECRAGDELGTDATRL